MPPSTSRTTFRHAHAGVLEQQAERYIRQYFALHGYAPSVREIAAHLGDGVNSRSTSLVKDVLRRLRERKRIVGLPDGRARAFTLPELMDAARALVTTTSSGEDHE
jgi:SOS-response transcriptional repressor LexA